MSATWDFFLLPSSPLNHHFLRDPCLREMIKRFVFSLRLPNLALDLLSTAAAAVVPLKTSIFNNSCSEWKWRLRQEGFFLITARGEVIDYHPIYM